MFVRQIARILTVFAYAAVCATAAHAGTYYVAPNGSDASDGSQASPLATIQAAVDRAGPGDTVVVAPGTYAGALITTSGVRGAPITLIGVSGAVIASPSPLNINGDNLWVRNAHYIVVENFEVRNSRRAGIAVQGEPESYSIGVEIRGNVVHDNEEFGIFTGYAQDVLIEGNEVFAAGRHGISVSNSADNPVIRRNASHHNREAGIQINNEWTAAGDGVIEFAVVEANVIYENGRSGAAGINLASVNNSLIVNNLLYDNHASGIALTHNSRDEQFGSKSNRIFHNTIIQAPDGRYALSMKKGSTGNAVANNILLHLGDKGSIEIDRQSMDGLTSDHNVLTNTFVVGDEVLTRRSWQNKFSKDGSSIASKPKKVFADFRVKDFRARAGSPAIDVGIPLADVATDALGVPRPQGNGYDIGAFEFAP